MEYRIEELRQMLAMIEDALQERPGVILLHEDRARLRANRDKVKLHIAQLEQTASDFTKLDITCYTCYTVVSKVVKVSKQTNPVGHLTY